MTMGSEETDITDAYIAGYERGKDSVMEALHQVQAERDKMKAALMEIAVPLEALLMADSMSPYGFSDSLRSDLRSAVATVRQALTGKH